MFSLLKKIVFYGVIIYALYWLFAEGGIEKAKGWFMSNNQTTNSQEVELKELKKAPWKKADKELPDEYESKYIPEGKLKTKIKKLTNKLKDEYGYNK